MINFPNSPILDQEHVDGNGIKWVFNGEMWIQTLMGIMGPTGPAGIDGSNGNDGLDGPTGPEGPEGPAGSGGFEAGTIMLFYQAAAPLGWTQLTNRDNHMLRVVAVAGGGFGGSSSPVSSHNHSGPSHSHNMSSHTHNGPSHTHLVDPHDHQTWGATLSISTSAAHAHSLETKRAQNNDGNFGYPNEVNDGDLGSHPTNSIGGSAGHVHGNTLENNQQTTLSSGTAESGGPSTANTSSYSGGTTGSSFTPKYIDVIQCSKD